MRTIKNNDYILIIDKFDNYFLKIGEVIDIEYYPDGDIKKYTVMFGYNYETSAEELGWYRYDLPERCRVLQFVNR